MKALLSLKKSGTPITYCIVSLIVGGSLLVLTSFTPRGDCRWSKNEIITCECDPDSIKTVASGEIIIFPHTEVASDLDSCFIYKVLVDRKSDYVLLLLKGKILSSTNSVKVDELEPQRDSKGQYQVFSFGKGQTFCPCNFKIIGYSTVSKSELKCARKVKSE